MCNVRNRIDIFLRRKQQFIRYVDDHEIQVETGKIFAWSSDGQSEMNQQLF